MLLAVDIGGTKMACVFLKKETHEIVTEHRVPTGSTFTYQIVRQYSPPLTRQAEEGIRKFLSEHPEETSKLVGVALAIPGLLDGDKVLRTIDIPGLEGWIPKDMPEFSNLVVKIIHDGKAAGVETAHHCAKDATVITLVVGTGIGSSFIIEGKPLLGKNGWAGELGACFIGSASHVDYQAGGKWLLSDRMGGITPEEMVALVEKKDPTALEAIRESGRFFGYVVSSLINIFNPEKIVIGGGTLRWEGYWDAASEAAKVSSVPDLWDACSIEVVKDPHLWVAKGAARAVAALLD